MAALRAWAAVHDTRTAALLLTVSAVLSVAVADVRVASVGPLRFVAPVSALLLVPVLSGLACAAACDLRLRSSLPDPPNARAARLAWSVGWLALGAAAANAGQLMATSTSPAAIVRNVLVYGLAALLLVTLGRPQLAWLPSVVLMLATMLFGSPVSEELYPWWALLVRPDVTRGQGLVVAVGIAAVVAGYVIRKPGSAAD